MRRAEEGEFELILGNRQLLSVFFIVVVLLGVFFTMGYIVGKNTSPDVIAGNRPPIVVDPTKGQGEQVVDPRKTPEINPTVPAVKTALEIPKPRPAETKPEQPEVAKPTEPVKPTQTSVEQTPVERPAPNRSPRLTSTGDPATGQTFLQVVASTKADCDIIIDVLKKKGLSGVTVPGPREGIYRALIGPIEKAEVTATRSALAQAGFKDPILRNY